MKRACLLLLILFSFPVFSTKIQLLDNQAPAFHLEKSKHLLLSFHLASLQLKKSSYTEKGINFRHIGHKDLPNTMDPGYPSLPFKSVILADRPENIQVNITPGEAQALDFLPTPAPRKPCRCDKDLSWNYFRHPYDKQQKFYQLEYLGDYRGQSLTRLSLFPFKTTNKELIVYPKLEAEVMNTKPWEKPLSTLMEPTLLIVTPSQWETQWQGFIQYKQSKGFKTELVVYDRVAHDKEGLQSFLKDRFKKSPYEYVIIAGNRNIIPSFITDTRFDSLTPTDLPYFLFGDEEDFIPDVFYGRFVVNSAEELQNYFQKIYQHEKHLKKSLFRRPLLLGIASDEGQNPSDEEYLSQMQSPLKWGLWLRKKAFHQDRTNSTPLKVNRVLNSGVYWLNYIGHGDGFSWPSMNTQYNVQDIDELANFKLKPVIIDVACQNGRLEGEGTFGEKFLTASYEQKQTGAVAYYGGSVNISWDPPAIMAIGISKSVKEQQKALLGSHLLNGHLYLIENYSSLDAAKENLVWYHLFGDPSLSVRLKR